MSSDPDGGGGGAGPVSRNEMALELNDPEPLLPKPGALKTVRSPTSTTVSIKSPTESTTVEKKKQDRPPVMSRSQKCCKDDCGVCVTIIGMTVLAVIVTTIKIIIIDISQYPNLFGGGDEEGPHQPHTTPSSENWV